MTHDQTVDAPDGTPIAWSRPSGQPLGDAPTGGVPVVLVHGITERAATFDPIIDRLLAQRRLFDVVTLDLRGHGQSGAASTYDLGSMAGDVVSVIGAAGLSSEGVSTAGVHLVGHSLGGAVVSAVGASIPVASVVDIDQSLQLAAFKSQLVAAEALLRDPYQYQVVVDMMFDMMSGTMLAVDERARIDSLRRADHEVVLGVWELLLTASEDEIAATIDATLAGHRSRPTPYLALFGLDPGDHYRAWLADRIPESSVELWADHGHYPHLVDPDRFVARLVEFWGD